MCTVYTQLILIHRIHKIQTDYIQINKDLLYISNVIMNCMHTMFREIHVFDLCVCLYVYMQLMQKFSSQFGYEKEVSVPPTCLLTVVGDNSVPDYTKRLHCPVLLRGALIGVGEQESMIFIKRTMSEKGTCT